MRMVHTDTDLAARALDHPPPGLVRLLADAIEAGAAVLLAEEAEGGRGGGGEGGGGVLVLL